MKPGPFRVALTYDVERNSPPFVKSTGKVYSGMEVMPEVLQTMKAQGAPGTWYIAHDVDPENQIALRFPEITADMAGQGEVGTHVHFREYQKVRTDVAFVTASVSAATECLRSEGYPAKSFRGGNLYMSPVLLDHLEDLGYETDSSVLPGHRVTMNDGLRVDHTERRSCEPYYPKKSQPWSAGGKGILEIPLSAFPLLSFATPFFSVLINYLVLISNLVLLDPELAIERMQRIRNKWPTENAVIVLSAHPHDFLADSISTEAKLENFEAFLKAVNRIPGASFATAADIRSGWVGPDQANRDPRDRAPLKLTTGDLRKAKQLLRRPVRMPHTSSV